MEKSLSIHYCRSIKFKYKKETIKSTLKKVNSVEEEVKFVVATSMFRNKIEIK